MKIKIALLLASLACLLGGCAAPTLVRGSDPSETVRRPAGGFASAQTDDYRQVLADPGPF